MAAELRKRERYATIAQRHIFVPVAVETAGALGPAAAAFLSDLGRRVSEATGDHREVSHGCGSASLSQSPEGMLPPFWQPRARSVLLKSACHPAWTAHQGHSERIPDSTATQLVIPSLRCEQEYVPSHYRRRISRRRLRIAPAPPHSRLFLMSRV